MPLLERNIVKTLPTRVSFKTIGKGDDRKLVRVAKRSGVEIDG